MKPKSYESYPGSRAEEALPAAWALVVGLLFLAAMLRLSGTGAPLPDHRVGKEHPAVNKPAHPCIRLAGAMPLHGDCKP
jgi:hypothetical protein